MGKLTLRSLDQSDIDEIVLAFKEIGWNKPTSTYEAYLTEQHSGLRLVFIARMDGVFCGYITLKWKSNYQSFATQHIPEIADLNVLPQYRKKGIGTMLIEACERLSKERGHAIVGLGVGLTADYGNAQRLYVQLGYVPDGNGMHYNYVPVPYGDTVKVDDDLVIYLTKVLT